LALPQPSGEASQVLSDLTQGGLSTSEINALSAAVAQVDSGVQSPHLRQALFSQVAGVGMFFRNSDTNGFPRWPVMTALRVYGLNLSTVNSQPEEAVAVQVQQTLSAAAQSRGATLDQALAQANGARVVGPVVAEQASPAPRVPAKAAAPVATPAAVPAGTPSAAVAPAAGTFKAVDKLV
jgi:hypothetical protein